MDEKERSYRKIEIKHLQKLKDISVNDQNIFFNKNPKYEFFRDRLFCILLVQGAALHYVNGTNGIKDFDILLLYKQNLEEKDENGKLIKIPYRRLIAYDCGMPEFGRYPHDDINQYPNRRVDVLIREIGEDLTDNYDLITGIRKYFETGNTPSIKQWKNKDVVGIWPEEIQGDLVWNTKSHSDNY
ncbi:conserved hypothetical protein [Methanohalobium evestigatum Z-7303]|uniref:Uncharacterized protein n=1 Tax=Methanohalobium evestigatum (strain ATCC BAA-1072 / DSM 3721 / NBRC 107634 / OCM 161 / Z-7303) TaxID=644295 RepID=D7E843_METEZ|nr:hypothetical protein [Methanohalobium evestigatum]ADI73385.1 conserved hypothetical protein [Methanohalobium evestigatum Z-7303]